MPNNDTILHINAEHANATLDITMPGTATADMTVWTLADGALAIGTERLLLDGGSLGEYDPSTRGASVTFRATVGPNANRLVLPSGDRLYVSTVNNTMTRARLHQPAPTLDHVEVNPGIYVCEAHRGDHFFLLGHRPDGEMRLWKLECTSGHGNHASFTDHPTCRPAPGASLNVLLNDQNAAVRLRVTAEQFPGQTRVP